MFVAHSFDPDSLALLLYGLAGLGYCPGPAWIRAYLTRSRSLLSTPRGVIVDSHHPRGGGSFTSNSKGGKPATPRPPKWSPMTAGYGAKSIARTVWSLAALLGGSSSSAAFSAGGGRRGGNGRQRQGARTSAIVPAAWLNRWAIASFVNIYAQQRVGAPHVRVSLC